jgi:hypothetical protein
MEVLLDEFLRSYADVAAAMRASYPLFERDGWRCSVPGCSAHGPLHLHHIVFRAHGGGDEAENLTSMCNLHHLALHDGWIRCVGRAPDGLYWELGTDRGNQFGGAPVARIAGHRRLDANEYWDGVRVRCMTNRAGAARCGSPHAPVRKAARRSGGGPHPEPDPARRLLRTRAGHLPPATEE